GYFLHPDFHGKGLGMRMAMSVIKWACENTDLQTLKGDVDPANEASKKMLAKMGLDVAEYHETGPYSDRDGNPLPSMIMKGSREQVESALQNYLHHHKDQLFDVQDAVIDTFGDAAEGAINPAVIFVSFGQHRHAMLDAVMNADQSCANGQPFAGFAFRGGFLAVGQVVQ